jgi:hypothetical protein
MAGWFDGQQNSVRQLSTREAKMRFLRAAATIRQVDKIERL